MGDLCPKYNDAKNHVRLQSPTVNVYDGMLAYVLSNLAYISNDIVGSLAAAQIRLWTAPSA